MILEATQTEQPQADQTHHIVLVEDNCTHALMLDLLLQGERFYQTMHFMSGEVVLEQLDTIKSFQPSLFLVDYYLPRMTGLDLYAYLHATECFEQIPAIILTAKTLSKEENQRIEQNHLTVVYKPFDIDDFLNGIQQAIA